MKSEKKKLACCWLHTESNGSSVRVLIHIDKIPLFLFRFICKSRFHCVSFVFLFLFCFISFAFDFAKNFCVLFFFCSLRDDMYGRWTPHYFDWIFNDTLILMNSCYFTKKKKRPKREPEEGGHYMCVCVFCIYSWKFNPMLHFRKSNPRAKCESQLCNRVFFYSDHFYHSLSLFLQTSSSEQRQQQRDVDADN